MTIRDAKLEVTKFGMVLSKTEYGEFRVNFKGGSEETAYYTNDLGDAVATAKAMRDRQPQGSRSAVLSPRGFTGEPQLHNRVFIERFAREQLERGVSPDDLLYLIVEKFNMPGEEARILLLQMQNKRKSLRQSAVNLHGNVAKKVRKYLDELKAQGVDANGGRATILHKLKRDWPHLWEGYLGEVLDAVVSEQQGKELGSDEWEKWNNPKLKETVRALLDEGNPPEKVLHMLTKTHKIEKMVAGQMIREILDEKSSSASHQTEREFSSRQRMGAEKNYPKRPNYKEEKYVDWDEDSASYGIFGLESGFCYATYASEEQAKRTLRKEEGRESSRSALGNGTGRFSASQTLDRISDQLERLGQVIPREAGNLRGMALRLDRVANTLENS